MIDTKLGAARARLILEHPFIGSLVLHLPLRSTGGWCERIATDARAIYYNPRYIDGLTLGETQFALAHEALHCALGHFARRGHRTRRRWDVASDYAVNQLLIDEGLKPPPDALVNPAFRGLAAEEIYPLIAPDTDLRTLDQHIEAGTDGVAGHGAGRSCTARGGPPEPQREDSDPAASEAAYDVWDDAGNERRPSPGRHGPAPARSRAEDEALVLQWQGRLALAAQQAHRAGRLGAAWLRSLGTLLEPRLPWRALLARYMMSIARDDYSFGRLNRREGPALLPRLASGELDVWIALDTSGSIAPAELAAFAAEVNTLKGQVRARVTLLACDAAIDARGPWVYEMWEPLVLPTGLCGGGGTSFAPVFERVEREPRRPDVLLYFTDAEGDFPAAAPDYPVLWLVKGGASVPWGERIQLN